MDVEEAVTSLAPGLLRFCTGLVRSVPEGEDLAQEALASLVRYWRRSGPPDSPAAFVYAVARRQAFRLHRRLRRFVGLEAVEDAHAPRPGPDSSAQDRQELARALLALESLSASDREAILMAATGDLSTDEAAKIIGVSPAAFKMRVHRARRRLLDYLGMEHDRGTEDLEGARARS